MNKSRTDLLDVGQKSWTCTYLFNDLRGATVKARLKKKPFRINAASNNSRSVQGYMHQGVSVLRMKKLDVQFGSLKEAPDDNR